MKQTLAEIVLKQIKLGILSGEFKPGEKLNIEMLKRRYGIGLTPIREALNRLVSHEFVKFTSSKGFKVTAISKQGLQDLYTTRQLIESKALELAIKYGDDQWESEVLASYYRLSKLEKSKEFIANPNLLAWLERYQDFHYSMLKACHSKWLLAMHQLLAEHSDRYRYLRLVKAPNFKAMMQKKIKIHKQLVDAILARDATQAVKLLSDELSSTVSDLLLSLE